MNKENVIIFGDSAGRLLIGEKMSENTKSVKVACPHVIDAQMDQENNMGIRFSPYAYLELVEEASKGVWEFPVSTHVFNNVKASQQSVDLYEKVVEQYKAVEMKIKEADEGGSEDVDDNVVKLVD